VLADLREFGTPNFDGVVDFVVAMMAGIRFNVDGGSPKLRRMLEGCGYNIANIYKKKNHLLATHLFIRNYTFVAVVFISRLHQRTEMFLSAVIAEK